MGSEMCIRDSQKTLLAGREPETLAAMNWIVSQPFVLSGNLGDGRVVATYPFDNSANDGGYFNLVYVSGKLEMNKI